MGANKIGDAGATAIANAIAVNASLKSLWLTINKIGDAGAAAIANAIAVNASVTSLGLTGNSIGDAAIDAAKAELRAAATARPSLTIHGV